MMITTAMQWLTLRVMSDCTPTVTPPSFQAHGEAAHAPLGSAPGGAGSSGAGSVRGEPKLTVRIDAAPSQQQPQQQAAHPQLQLQAQDPQSPLFVPEADSAPQSPIRGGMRRVGWGGGGGAQGRQAAPGTAGKAINTRMQVGVPANLCVCVRACVCVCVCACVVCV